MSDRILPLYVVRRPSHLCWSNRQPAPAFAFGVLGTIWVLPRGPDASLQQNLSPGQSAGEAMDNGSMPEIDTTRR